MSEKGQEDTYRPAGSTARQPLILGGAATEDPAEPSPSCSVQGLVRSIIGSRAPPPLSLQPLRQSPLAWTFISTTTSPRPQPTTYSVGYLQPNFCFQTTFSHPATLHSPPERRFSRGSLPGWESAQEKCISTRKSNRGPSGVLSP